MSTQAWFPTPIYTTQLEGVEFQSVQTELSNVIDNFVFSQNPNWGLDTHELSGDAFSDDSLSKFKCKHFLKILDKHVNLYLNDLNCHPDRQYVITQSWFTKTKNGKYAHRHDHGANDISGVYYLKTNQHDGNLYFESLNRPLSSNFVFGCIPAEQELPSKEGLMALWPSMLNHGTRINNTDHERISVSFNLQFMK